MKQMNDLIEQMVKDISSQAQGLDPVRLGLFLGWLCAHCALMKAIPPQQEGIEGQLEPALRSWLGSLPAQGMLWEYRLILDEIAWWRDLDARRLHMLLKTEAVGHNG